MIHTTCSEITTVNLRDSQVYLTWEKVPVCDVVRIEVLERVGPFEAGHAVRNYEKLGEPQQSLSLRFHSLVALNDFIAVAEKAREGFEGTAKMERPPGMLCGEVVSGHRSVWDVISTMTQEQVEELREFLRVSYPDTKPPKQRGIGEIYKAEKPPAHLCGEAVSGEPQESFTAAASEAFAASWKVQKANMLSAIAEQRAASTPTPAQRALEEQQAEQQAEQQTLVKWFKNCNLSPSEAIAYLQFLKDGTLAPKPKDPITEVVELLKGLDWTNTELVMDEVTKRLKADKKE